MVPVMFWKTSRIVLGRLDAADVAAGETADQRNVHAADEADLAGLGGECREHADEIAALMLLEHDRGDIRRFDDHVDDGELRVGEFRRDLLHRFGMAEADGDDRREAALGEFAQGLLALAVVLDLEILIGDAGVGLEFLSTHEGAFVEGFVVAAAEVVDDRRLDIRREACARHQRRHGNGRKQLPDHEYLPVLFSFPHP